MIDYNDMKDKIEEIGYYATEELLYDTYNALYMIDEEEKQTGQDIYAICLEGPPGAGKTAFAKTYTEICKKMVDDKTEMISYQCDATTGKSELFEDINETKYYALCNIDVLVDGEFKVELRDITLPFCGSSNQRIINVKESLKKGCVVLEEIC